MKLFFMLLDKKKVTVWFSLHDFFHSRNDIYHSFFLFSFSLKASFLKGIGVRAITSFGENTVIQAHRHSAIFCALSGAKIMLTDQTSVPRHFVRTLHQVAFSWLDVVKMNDEAIMIDSWSQNNFRRRTLLQLHQDKDHSKSNNLCTSRKIQ